MNSTTRGVRSPNTKIRQPIGPPPSMPTGEILPSCEGRSVTSDGEGGGRRRSRRPPLRSLAVDIEPLRASRDFRRIWTGLLVSELGYQFTLVATFVQVQRLTDSPAAVGVIGLVGLVALVAGTLIGSTIIDAYDRRKLLVLAQLGFMAASGLLLVGTLVGRPPVGLIYAAVALIAAVSAIDGPTRSAMTPRLVGRELLPSALALSQVIWNGTALVGPALAGIVIARLDLSWAYGIDLVTYLAMVFGMPRALFPFLAASQFHAGAQVTGLLFSAPAVGALGGALTAGWVSRVRHQGRAVIYAVVLWGAGIAAFGLVGDHLWIALAFLAFAGAADVISAVFRSTILQLSVPDSLRGRLSGFHILVVTGGPRLGDLEAGLVAAAFSPAVSVVSGGLLCIAGTALLALLVPELRRYHAGDDA